MRGQFLLFISILHILNLAATANSRPLVPNGTELPNSSRSSGTNLTFNKENGGKENLEEAEENREVNRIGSSPPSCEHKCYGCMPCQAIQVPTTTGHVGVQYANYEPEGWKCKCGPTLYTP
ncbi:OLC1v1015068C1 [Oldenlandia corymbosa var. corymbosa]|uniref:Epidermal patterning factor-like protein n=1 Tax=Oldenlandia corymbosa var. corymbosa TaxID=529605 RepID=A0AAV1E2J6_OLDCO|nr:OLC1v1015068C1 [Oldenlandia corymbosa var. corymbosa]